MDRAQGNVVRANRTGITPAGQSRFRYALMVLFAAVSVSAQAQGPSSLSNWASLPDWPSLANWPGIWNQPPENPLWMTNFDKIDSPSVHRFEPLFGFDAGVIVLQRSHPDSFDLVSTDGTLGPTEVMATSEIMESDPEVGVRFTATMYNLTDHFPGLDMDFAYFNVDSIGTTQVVDANGFNTTDVLPSFFGGIPASPVPSYTLITDSDIDSFEWMMGYRPFARFRMMLGLRWVELKETFDVLDTGQLPTRSGFYSNAHNELFGWQIGGEAILWSGEYLRVFVKAKYANLNNDVGGNAVAENVQFAFNGDHDSSLVDIEIGGSIPLGDFASFKIAYQGLFFSDAAGAFEQSDLQSFFDPALQTPQFHDLEYHGVQFMISCLW